MENTRKEGNISEKKASVKRKEEKPRKEEED